MSRARPRSELPSNLFQQLAVLVGMIGSLVLPLLVLSRLAAKGRDGDQQTAARRQVAALRESLPPLPEPVRLPELPSLPGPQPESKSVPLPPLPEIVDPRAEVAKRRDQLRAKLSAVRAQAKQPLTANDRELAELAGYLADLKRRLLDLSTRRAWQAQEAARLKREVDTAAGARDEKRARLRHVENRFAIVPYVGPNGTRRRPVYFECRRSAITLQPEGVELDPALLVHADRNDNAMSVLMQAVVAELRTENDDEAPYPLLLVRPDGIAAYYLARAALSRLDLPMGFETIAGDLELAYPPAEPRAKAAALAVLDRFRGQPPTRALVASLRPETARLIYGDRGPAFLPGSTPNSDALSSTSGSAAGRSGFAGGFASGSNAAGDGSGDMGIGGERTFGASVPGNRVRSGSGVGQPAGASGGHATANGVFADGDGNRLGGRVIPMPAGIPSAASRGVAGSDNPSSGGAGIGVPSRGVAVSGSPSSGAGTGVQPPGSSTTGDGARVNSAGVDGTHFVGGSTPGGGTPDGAPAGGRIGPRGVGGSPNASGKHPPNAGPGRADDDVEPGSGAPSSGAESITSSNGTVPPAGERHAPPRTFEEILAQRGALQRKRSAGDERSPSFDIESDEFPTADDDNDEPPALLNFGPAMSGPRTRRTVEIECRAGAIVLYPGRKVVAVGSERELLIAKWTIRNHVASLVRTWSETERRRNFKPVLKLYVSPDGASTYIRLLLWSVLRGFETERELVGDQSAGL